MRYKLKNIVPFNIFRFFVQALIRKKNNLRNLRLKMFVDFFAKKYLHGYLIKFKKGTIKTLLVIL